MCLYYFCNRHPQSTVPTQHGLVRPQVEKLPRSGLSSFSLVIKLSPSGLSLSRHGLVNIHPCSFDCSVSWILTPPAPSCVTRDKCCPSFCFAPFFHLWGGGGRPWAGGLPNVPAHKGPVLRWRACLTMILPSLTGNVGCDGWQVPISDGSGSADCSVSTRP